MRHTDMKFNFLIQELTRKSFAIEFAALGIFMLHGDNPFQPNDSHITLKYFSEMTCL